MHHDIDPFHCTAQALLIANIADKKAHTGVVYPREILTHFVLLQLVAREHDQAVDVRVPLEHRFDKGLAE